MCACPALSSCLVICIKQGEFCVQYTYGAILMAACLQAIAGDSRDTGWVALLQGLSAAAEHALPSITDVLLSWRKSCLAAANRQAKELSQHSTVVLRKRVQLPGRIDASVHIAQLLAARILTCEMIYVL